MAEKKTTKKKPSPSPAAGTPMDPGLLEQIIKLMAANDVNTVDLREEGRRVVIKRGPTYVTGAAGPAPQMAMAPGAPAPAGGTAPATEAPKEDAGLIPMRSPMVGTFYTAPKPGEKPFINIGSRVVKDETEICVIEAMKNYFVQKADVTGTIVKVLVENGHPVQAEQPMFLVKPA